VARLSSNQTSLVRTYIELNERRNELIRVERLALAGQLAAGLLHDLRKPVLNIQHSLGDMAEALGDFAPAAAPFQDLQRNTRLFFQILAESQIERFVQSDRVGEEYLDIVPMIDFSLSLVRYERRGVEVVRRESDNLPPVLAQPFRLVQLFSNLILNAYQAMGGRGILTIDALPVERGVEVRLTDTGPGIPPEHLPHIYEPFYTTKPQGEGTGLGLSICRMIVEDQKGRIAVASRPGEGTVFSVWLPGEEEGV
jgi:signal transduction histidine kinase